MFLEIIFITTTFFVIYSFYKKQYHKNHLCDHYDCETKQIEKQNLEDARMEIDLEPLPVLKNVTVNNAVVRNKNAEYIKHSHNLT